MDVGLYKPFQDHYRNKYDEWFVTAPDGEKPKRPVVYPDDGGAGPNIG